MTVLLRARRVLTEQGWLDNHQLHIDGSLLVNKRANIIALDSQLKLQTIWIDGLPVLL
ncbi:hypothetical protein [Yersinia alsatica]|uniref:hypothetical protein n=1 Tax=Yersinia alsatica TaxID=2890317 RepID=UPI0005E8532E|nr:hypothetical protein [Yersinia alsatica]CNK40248.1 Uncharacterised protein [Yersinia frederiksenii]